jgi:hypothetical protein
VHTDFPCIHQPPVAHLLGPPVVGFVLPSFDLLVYSCIDDVCVLKNHPTTGELETGLGFVLLWPLKMAF